MIKTKSIPIIAFIFLLNGCTTLPHYQLKPEESYTKIKSIGLGWLSICVDGIAFIPAKSNQPKEYLIPTNKRVSVKKHMVFSGYNITHSCSPSLSLIPQKDKTYIAESNIIDKNYCHIDLVQADDTKDVGVSFESSVEAGECPRG